MAKENVKIDEIRLFDHDVASGVYLDMTKRGWLTDEWLTLFERISKADILIMESPFGSVKSLQWHKN